MTHRWLFIAAIVAGLTYMASWDLSLPNGAAIAWKGTGVGLLAIWASWQGRSTDHRLLAALLALGATADMVLELDFVIGAAIFAVGHVVAITLYVRNRVSTAPMWQRLLPLPVLLLLANVVFRLVPPEWSMPVIVYSLFLTGMLATAANSRFALAAVGAALFVLSDTLIFARLGPLAGAAWIDPVVWITYFAGQSLIAWGVARKLDFRAAPA